MASIIFVQRTALSPEDLRATPRLAWLFQDRNPGFLYSGSVEIDDGFVTDDTGHTTTYALIRPLAFFDPTVTVRTGFVNPGDRGIVPVQSRFRSGSVGLRGPEKHVVLVTYSPAHQWLSGSLTLASASNLGSLSNFSIWNGTQPDPKDFYVETATDVDSGAVAGPNVRMSAVFAPDRRTRYLGVGARVYAMPNSGSFRNQYFKKWMVERVPVGTSTPSPNYGKAREVVVKVRPNRLNFSPNPKFDVDTSNWTVVSRQARGSGYVGNLAGVGAGSVTVTNLLPNPRLGTNITGWAVYPGAGGVAPATRVTTGGPDNGPFIRGTWTTAATSVGGPNTSQQRIQLVEGKTYYARGWVRSSRATRMAIYMERSQLSTGGTYMGNVVGPGVVIPANTWVEITASFTVDASTAGQWLNASFYVTPGTGFTSYPQVGDTVDATMAVITDTVEPGGYFDGNTPSTSRYEYAWTGTADASTSVRRSNPAATHTVPSLTVGETYTASVTADNDSSASVSISVSSGATILSQSNADVPGRASVTFVATSSTVVLSVQSTSFSVKLSNILVEEGTEVREYFDGSTSGDTIWEVGGTAGKTRSYLYKNRLERYAAIKRILTSNVPLGVGIAEPVFGTLPID